MSEAGTRNHETAYKLSQFLQELEPSIQLVSITLFRALQTQPRSSRISKETVILGSMALVVYLEI
jgi:hypothetical protein